MLADVGDDDNDNNNENGGDESHGVVVKVWVIMMVMATNMMRIMMMVVATMIVKVRTAFCCHGVYWWHWCRYHLWQWWWLWCAFSACIAIKYCLSFLATIYCLSWNQITLGICDYPRFLRTIYEIYKSRVPVMSVYVKEHKHDVSWKSSVISRHFKVDAGGLLSVLMA